MINVQTIVSIDSKEREQVSRLKEFEKEAFVAYYRSCDPRLSKWKITLSVMSLGLLPLINVICAISYSILAKKKHSELQEIQGQINDMVDIFLEDKIPNYEEKLNDPQEKEKTNKEILEAAKELQTQERYKKALNARISKVKEYLNYVEGTPFEIYE
jgi:hypothetical protein